MLAGSHEVRLHLILLAGGKGERAAVSAGAPPKQFQKTAKGPLFLVCLKEFLKLQDGLEFPLASVTITVPDSWRDEVAGHLKDMENVPDGISLSVPWLLASAGTTRTASTLSAIDSLVKENRAPACTDLVAVHDAARPFATADLLTRLCSAAFREKAAVPALPVADSLVQIANPSSSSSRKGEYVDRTTVFAVQTPQVFQWDVFESAHRWAAENQLNFTDDGSLLAERDVRPVVVSGETGNWKVTTPSDSDRAVRILSRSSD